MKTIKVILLAVLFAFIAPSVMMAKYEPATTVAELVKQDKTAGTTFYKGKTYTVYVGVRGGKYIVVQITRGENKGKYRKQYLPKN